MAKTWFNTVQNCYINEEDLGNYDEPYNICFHAGYIGVNRVKQMWDDNKIIGGSVYPADFGIITPKEMAEIMVVEYQEAVEFTEEDLFGKDYSDEAIEKIKSDLVKFINLLGLTEIQKIINETGEIFKSMFAHDFWLTRNGHGSGFWDSECWGEYQTVLTEKSKEMGDCDAYLGDDGLIYFSGGK